MILLVFPFQPELEAFLSGRPGRSETHIRGFAVHSLAGEPDWRLAVCGQGKVEAALACQILSDALNPGCVLLLGCATALDPGLEAGAIVVADPGIEWDFGEGKPPRFRPPRPFPETAGVVSGPILSGDKNVFDPAEKSALFGRYGAKALAWEGAGFHRFLRCNGKSGWEIRVITEAAREGRLESDGFRTRMAQGMRSLWAAAKAAGSL